MNDSQETTLLASIFDGVVAGRLSDVETHVQEASGAGISAVKILNEGLIAAMTEVGNRFERGELFIPEMLIAAKAMQAGLSLLKPHLLENEASPFGKVVLGTVKGDLHDIGKNLVAMMLEGAGFEVVDLGTDVSPQQFVEAVKTEKPQLVGLSALLTTTMANMKTTVEAMIEAKIRDEVKILIGGAPVTEDFANEIGIDGYAPDAIRAVTVAKGLLG